MPQQDQPAPNKSGPPVYRRTISALQGTGHLSEYVGKTVRTDGVVTAVERTGFYVQEEIPEASPHARSCGLFVLTDSPNRVRPGNKVRVEGTIEEFSPNPNHLTTTRLVLQRAPRILKNRVPIPDPLELGTAAHPLPSTTIYEAGLVYERFEGMRVRLPESRVIGPSNRRGDIFVVVQPTDTSTSKTESPTPFTALRTALSDIGASVRQRPVDVVRSLRNAMASADLLEQGRELLIRSLGGSTDSRSEAVPLGPDGTLREHPRDEYPSRLKISFDRHLYGPTPPRCDVGDRIGPIDGIFFHDRGFYGIKPTHPLQVFRSHRQPRVATLVGTEWGLTLATYNVNSLDPCFEQPSKVAPGVTPDDDLKDGRFDAIARHIVDNLQAPDIVALQEIEDNDGAEESTVTSASLTWTTLIAAMVTAGGPEYAWVDLDPQPGADGGRPHGNIRVGYLYNPLRVRLDPASVRRIGEDHDAFKKSRKSLAASFEFLPTRTYLYLVANHLKSKRNGTPTYRNPNVAEVVGGEEARRAQNEVIIADIRARLEDDPSLRLMSVGDFNANENEAPLRAPTADVLLNLGDEIPNHSRYSYIREGLAMAIDHQFASLALRGKVEFEYVHVNSAFADKASDHDPTLSRIDMR